MIEVSETAEAFLPKLDGILFDMDGVLLDITRSIRAVNCLAVPYFLREVLGWSAGDDLLTSADIELFKNAGGFNDDIDVTKAIVLHFLIKEHEQPGATAETLNVFQPSISRYAAQIAERGGGLKAAERICFEHLSYDDRVAIQMEYRTREIARVFLELFGGAEYEELYGRPPKHYLGEGYWKQDKPIIDLDRLAAATAPRLKSWAEGEGVLRTEDIGAMPVALDGNVESTSPKKLGILTGRTSGETKFGLRIAGLETIIPFTNVVTSDDGHLKPDPGGLRQLVERLGVTGGIYIGDTRDDYRTVENYRKEFPDAPPMIGALVLSGPMGDANARIFRRSQADVIASDVNEVLRWIAGPTDSRYADGA